MQNPVLVDYAALLLRLALALMFFAHAWLKIKVFTPAGAVKYFESLGLPGFFAYLTMAVEIAGGTLLLLGIGTRWVALLLIPLVAGTIVLVHGKNGWLFSNKDGWLGVPGLLDRRAPGSRCAGRRSGRAWPRDRPFVGLARATSYERDRAGI